MISLFIEDYTEPFELKKVSELSSRLASLGELTTGIAHEINNPVGLINQSMSLMQDIIDDMKRASPSTTSQPQVLQQGLEEAELYQPIGAGIGSAHWQYHPRSQTLLTLRTQQC